MRHILPIPNTLNVVKTCWSKAEDHLRADIEEKHHDLDEEMITQIFYGEFQYRLRQASEEHAFSYAFLRDLEHAFPELGYDPTLNQISAGLIADLTLHKKQVEKMTGGDFGLTIIRPQVEYGSWGDSELVAEEYQRGLLCQAKIKRRDGKWGGFSRKQKQVLPNRLDYLALVLYRYTDPDRRLLNYFQWQLCKSASFQEVEQWGKSDEFPHLLNSEEMLSLLGEGEIGTDDLQIIKQLIRPEGKPGVIIRIYWPPGTNRGRYILHHSKIRSEDRIRIYEYERGTYD